MQHGPGVLEEAAHSRVGVREGQTGVDEAVDEVVDRGRLARLPAMFVPIVAPACRPGCGACCIAPSISSPIPGMPRGKAAGQRCVQLTADLRCALFGLPERPRCCAGLMPSTAMCGDSPAQALAWLTQLELLTAPSGTVAAPSG